ncbi:hypothetical protein Hanom_Chr08g00696981 [Helianthus anomalus]
MIHGHTSLHKLSSNHLSVVITSTIFKGCLSLLNANSNALKSFCGCPSNTTNISIKRHPFTCVYFISFIPNLMRPKSNKPNTSKLINILILLQRPSHSLSSKKIRHKKP